ncbi:MAG: hypothetical protein LBP31_03460 [Holosporales bacterium]|nr:hypothetical protein [Holosporales bacterium]
MKKLLIGIVVVTGLVSSAYSSALTLLENPKDVDTTNSLIEDSLTTETRQSVIWCGDSACSSVQLKFLKWVWEFFLEQVAEDLLKECSSPTEMSLSVCKKTDHIVWLVNGAYFSVQLRNTGDVDSLMKDFLKQVGENLLKLIGEGLLKECNAGKK